MTYSIRHVFQFVTLVTFLAASGCASTRTTKSTGEYIDDAAISAKVKTELLANKNVKGSTIGVQTHKGVVQLSGQADSRAEATTAANIAESVRGVKSVKNDIIVKH